MRTNAVVGVAALAVAFTASVEGPAHAQPKDFKELLELKIPDAEPGVDKAKVMAPSWCGTVKPMEGYDSAGALSRTIRAGIETDWRGLVTAAQIICKWPSQPEVQHAAAVVTQHWMNYSGLDQKRAAEVLGLHAQEDRMKADKKKLCDQLTVSDEIEGEEKAFMEAKRHLFACRDDSPMWLSGATFTNFDNPLLPFLDAGAETPDELARLAYVLSRTKWVFDEKSSYRDKEVLTYITDHVDLGQLSEAAALAMLDSEPYKGNIYARAVVLGSAGRAKNAAFLVKAEIDKRSKDASWKELLVTAPQRGVAAYTAAAAQYKDQLARSAKFERTFWGPSKKAMQGCWAPLRKDFIDVMKAQKHGNQVETYEALNQPIPALLFSRLAACAAVEQDSLYAGTLIALAKDLRYSRGPRIAAYYAALETLGEILADRAKFPIKLDDLRMFRERAILDRAFQMEKPKSKLDNMPQWVGDAGEGTVKSIKKEKDAVVVTFVNTKTQIMSQSCVTTNRIITWEADGDPIYYRKCKDTGLVWINTTPMAIRVPAAWADGIKAGTIVKFEATPDYHTGKRWGMPVAVYADKKKNKLVNYYGFGL